MIVTLSVSGDPAAFEEQAAGQSEAIGRIMDVAKRQRTHRSPPDIAPLMQAVGGPPHRR